MTSATSVTSSSVTSVSQGGGAWQSVAQEGGDASSVTSATTSVTSSATSVSQAGGSVVQDATSSVSRVVQEAGGATPVVQEDASSVTSATSVTSSSVTSVSQGGGAWQAAAREGGDASSVTTSVTSVSQGGGESAWDASTVSSEPWQSGGAARETPRSHLIGMTLFFALLFTQRMAKRFDTLLMVDVRTPVSRLLFSAALSLTSVFLAEMLV